MTIVNTKSSNSVFALIVVVLTVRMASAWALLQIYGYPIGSSIDHRLSLAHAIASKLEFTYHGYVCMYHTPVYPMLLALLEWTTGIEWYSVAMMQGIMEAAVAVMLYKIVQETVVGDNIAGWLYAFYPLAIIHSASIVDTVPAAFLAVCAIYFTLRYIRSGSLIHISIAAMSMGIGILNRPVVAGVAVGMFYLIWQKQRLAGISRYILVGALIALAPCLWMLRNYAHVGEFPVLTTGSGHFLWFSHNTYVKQVWLKGVSPDVVGRDSAYAMHPSYHPDEFMLADPKAQLKMSREAAACAREYIASHPQDVVIYTAIKAMRYFSNAYVLDGKERTATQFLREYGIEVYLAIIYTLALIGLMWLWRNNRPIFWFIAISVVLIAMMNIGYQFVNRHKIYHDIFMIMLASVGARAVARGLHGPETEYNNIGL